MSGVRDDLMYEVPGSRLRELREAEARCARLQQALLAIAEGNLGDAPWQANYERARQFAREALAGLDTPADSQPEDGTAA